MDAYKELIGALDSEDDLGKVIRSHVIIENILIKIIESKLPEHTYYEKMDLTYEQKVNLAMCFNLDIAWYTPLKTLGTIRNGFAHKLRDQINKSDANNFYKSFTSRAKEVMKKEYEEKSEELKALGYPAYSNLLPIQKFSVCITILAAALDAWYEKKCKKS